MSKELEQLVEQTKSLEGKVGEALDSTEKATKQTRDELVAAKKSLDEGIAELRESVKKATSNGDAAQEEVKKALTRLEDLERRFGRSAGLPASEAPTQSTVKSFGGQFGDFLRANTELLEHAKRPGNQIRQSQRVAIEGLSVAKANRALDVVKALCQHPSDENVRKALALTDATNFSPISRQPNLPFIPSYRLVARDLIPSRPLDSATYQYLEYAGMGENTERSMTSITSTALAAIATTAAPHGLQVGDRVRISGSSDTEYNGYFFVTGITSSVIFTYNMLTDPSDDTADGTITWTPISRGGAAATVAEGGTKPQSKLAPRTLNGNPEVIAHIMKVTRQALADIPGLEADLNMFGVRGLAETEDYQILYGSGTTPDLTGILSAAQRQQYTQAVAGSVGLVSTVRHAQTMLALVGGRANGIIINPVDKESFDLAVGLDDHFLFRTAPEGGVAPIMWSTPVLERKSIDPGTILVGAFDLGAVIYDREAANVSFADQDDTDFQKNIVSFRFEERLGLAITRPEMFVEVTLS